MTQGLSFKDKITQALLGKQLPDVDTIDITGIDTTSPEFLENSPNMANIRIGNPERVGGLIPDLTKGFKENYTTGFAVDNLQPDTNKSLAYKVGEGLGTARRFLDSPTGRGLLMAGVVGATGGNGLQALTYGATAGVGRQQNKAANDLYRKALSEQGIDTSDIGGNLTDNMYKQILAAKQLQDNAEWRKLQNETLNAYRQAQLEANEQQREFNNQLAQQKLQDAREERSNTNYWKGRELQLGYDKLEAEKQKNDAKTNSNDLAELETQLKNFENMFDKVPNKLRGSTEGVARRKLGLASNNEAKFDAQRTLLFNQIARKLGGEKGVLSDQDIKRIQAALPTLSDSYEQRKAKMQAVYELLDIKKGSTAKADPLGIR